MKAKTIRKKRIRAKISGTASLPRVSVFRSHKYLYLQAIDDKNQKTIAAGSTLKSKSPAEDLAAQLKIKKIKKIVFDRSGYQYHGQVKKIAESLRKAGLEF